VSRVLRTRRQRGDPAGGDGRSRVLAAVSVGTALWLAAELFVVVTTRSTTWPFSAMTAFATPRSDAQRVSLQGVASSGERHTLEHEDFGFEAGNSLYAFVYRRIVRRDGRGVVARPTGHHDTRRLVHLYNKRHADDPLTRLHVDVRVTPVPVNSESTETTTRVLSVRP
jgi:hypothetical protein